MRPAFDATLDKLDLQPGRSLLDVGCGSGLATSLAAQRGARVTGVDAAEELLEIARTRTPEGEFRRADIVRLPWPDGSFDVVTGFNSFQYAPDPVQALAEARRVLRPGGRLGVVVWGAVQECEAVAHFLALRALLPPNPQAAPPLAGEQHIDDMARAAGFEIDTDERVDCPWRYPSLDVALRGLMSAGPVVKVVDAVGEQAVRDALSGCLADFRQADGSYLFRNKFRSLTGRPIVAPGR